MPPASAIPLAQERNMYQSLCRAAGKEPSPTGEAMSRAGSSSRSRCARAQPGENLAATAAA